MKINNRKKSKTTKLEKFIMGLILTVTIMTPISALTISSINLMKIKDLSAIEQEISDVKQESTEIETKMQEKLTYDQVSQFAAQGGMEKREERISNISVD